MDASDHRLAARKALAGHWINAMVVSLVAVLLGGAIVSSGVIWDRNIQSLKALPGFFLVLYFAHILCRFTIGGTIRLGHCQYVLKLQDHQEASIEDLFSQFEHFKKGFMLKILSTAFIALWSLLLVIPGIVASYSYAMAPFILYEHPEMSALDAINASNDMMVGHKWELFCLSISFIGWEILAALTFGIGFLFLNPYLSQAYASFYRNLQAQTASVESGNPYTEI